jgi:hypothetical protein
MVHPELGSLFTPMIAADRGYALLAHHDDTRVYEKNGHRVETYNHQVSRIYLLTMPSLMRPQEGQNEKFYRGTQGRPGL